PGQHPHQRGLAGPVRAEQPGQPAGQPQADLVQRADPAAAEAHGQVADLDAGRGGERRWVGGGHDGLLRVTRRGTASAISAAASTTATLTAAWPGPGCTPRARAWIRRPPNQPPEAYSPTGSNGVPASVGTKSGGVRLPQNQ